MKEIRTVDAIGHIISHDITRIIPGGEKAVAFKKGHIVREEDVPELLKIGKANLYVWENDGTMLHENDAASLLADIVGGDGFLRGEVKEGKIELFTDRSGVLRVDKGKLAVLNGFDEVMVATRHDYSAVRAGDKIAGTRIIPLAIKADKMQEVRDACGGAGATGSDGAGVQGPAGGGIQGSAGGSVTGSASGGIQGPAGGSIQGSIGGGVTGSDGGGVQGSDGGGVQGSDGGGAVLSLHPYTHKRFAIVTTGSEVFEGLIEDGFTPIVRKKMEEFDSEDLGNLKTPDNPNMTASAIRRFVEKGADIVFVTGGMSVDPDDKTPLAIKTTGAEIVSYGAPVLPGAMFMVAYLGDVAILGLPGCVMHSERTIFDIVLPRVMADIRITKQDINDLAAGGLCLSCEVCVYPICGFGAV